MQLSIIIPIYRTEHTLQRCVESIIQQSFTDYEIILVDDESPDACPQMCDDYAVKDKRIKVIHKTNGGLSDARNAGINQAKGEYITFIDSDDAIKNDTLSQLMNELYQHPDVDILEYPVLERYGHPHKQHQLTFSSHEYTNNTEYWFKERAYNHTYAWNKIYKRHLFEYIRFPKGKTFEDVLTMPYLIGLIPIQGKELAPKIRMTDRGCYVYYWNQQGITANAKYKDLLSLYQGHTSTLQHILSKIEDQKELLNKYSLPLQDFMLQILNVLLDLYELSGRFEPNPPLIHYVEKLGKTLNINSYKLKLLNILGYHTLCRLNRLIHKIYRNH